jgi:Immunoglobulin-like domain of bacterial spore germination/Sporulation and spore germination
MNDFSHPNDRPDGSPDDRPDDQAAQIRLLLDDAVSNVEPREGLDSIRSRTAVTPLRARRPLMWGASAVVLATAATVVAVTAFSGGLGTTPRVKNGFVSTPTVTVTMPAVAAVPVYYVGNTSHGARLFREFHKSNGQSALVQAVAEALEGRGSGAGADDPDYRTGWPKGTAPALGGTTLTGSGTNALITIDLKSQNGGTSLPDRPAGMSKAAASLALQQLVYTAQGATRTTAPVQFLVNGHPTDQLLGQPASEPLTRASADTVLAQVWIIAPADGQHVGSPFTVNGLASAFEANVQWELMRGGSVVKKGFTTAKECCIMSPYSFTVKAPPGEYTLVVHDSDPSDGEGLGPWRDTKDITIVP